MDCATGPFSKPGVVRDQLCSNGGAFHNPGSEGLGEGRRSPLPSPAGLIGGRRGASCPPPLPRTPSNNGLSPS